MEYNHQRVLQLPSAYAVLSEEEMTYTDGGAFSFNITQEQVIVFAANVVVNTLYIMGQGAFEYFYSTFTNGYNDGLSVAGTISHQLGKMNTWSKVAACGLVVLGGYYVYSQVSGIVQSVMEIVNAFVSSFSQSQPDQMGSDPTGLQPAPLAI